MAEDPEQQPVTDRARAEEDEISLLDLAVVLAKHKEVVLGLPFAAAAVAALVSLLMTPIYTASARILPPQQSQSATAALLGNLGALTGIVPSSLGIRNPADLYVGMLQSRTVADQLISRFDLQKLYETKTLDDTRRGLKDKTSVRAGRDGIITIEVEDTDPKRAAEMANAYVEELDKLTQSLAVTEAAQRRLFFEKQLKQAKDNLAEAEVELKKTQEQTGLIKLDEQGRAIIEAVANLRAQVAAKEVQLTAMRSFATERNPDYIRVQQELAGLRAQLLRLEKTNTAGGGDIFVPTGKVPESGLEYIRKLREVKYHETLFELLAKQFEVAKADEAKDAGFVQVVDKAVPPDKKSKPKRALIVIFTAVVAAFLAVVWAFVREAGERARRDPDRAARLEALRAYLRFK